MGDRVFDIMEALAEDIGASIHRLRGNIWTFNLKGNLFCITYIRKENRFTAPGDLQNILEDKFNRIAAQLMSAATN